MSKYDNPISEVPMVNVPKWEYAQLVGKAAMLELLGKLVSGDKKYVANDILDVLFSDVPEEDE